MNEDKFFKVATLKVPYNVYYYREDELTLAQKMSLAVRGSHGVLDVSEVSKEEYEGFFSKGPVPTPDTHFELELLPTTVKVKESDNVIVSAIPDYEEWAMVIPLPEGVKIKILSRGGIKLESVLHLQTAALLRDALVEWGKLYDF